MIEDDIIAAVSGLDQFTKNYCTNVAETEKRKDLVFRCEECEFNNEVLGVCRVKLFVNNHSRNDANLKEYIDSMDPSFGAMGTL